MDQLCTGGGRITGGLTDVGGDNAFGQRGDEAVLTFDACRRAVGQTAVSGSLTVRVADSSDVNPDTGRVEGVRLSGTMTGLNVGLGPMAGTIKVNVDEGGGERYFEIELDAQARRGLQGLAYEFKISGVLQPDGSLDLEPNGAFYVDGRWYSIGSDEEITLSPAGLLVAGRLELTNDISLVTGDLRSNATIDFTFQESDVNGRFVGPPAYWNG